MYNVRRVFTGSNDRKDNIQDRCNLRRIGRRAIYEGNVGSRIPRPCGTRVRERGNTVRIVNHSIPMCLWRVVTMNMFWMHCKS